MLHLGSHSGKACRAAPCFIPSTRDVAAGMPCPATAAGPPAVLNPLPESCEEPPLLTGLCASLAFLPGVDVPASSPIGCASVLGRALGTRPPCNLQPGTQPFPIFLFGGLSSEMTCCSRNPCFQAPAPCPCSTNPRTTQTEQPLSPNPCASDIAHIALPTGTHSALVGFRIVVRFSWARVVNCDPLPTSSAGMEGAAPGTWRANSRAPCKMAALPAARWAYTSM